MLPILLQQLLQQYKLYNIFSKKLIIIIKHEWGGRMYFMIHFYQFSLFLLVTADLTKDFSISTRLPCEVLKFI